MKKIIGLFFAFMISNTISIDLSSNLEFQKGKIVDQDLSDSEMIYPLQNFLIELDENEEFSLSAEITSKRIIDNKELLYIDNLMSDLNAYSQHEIQTSENDRVTYFISEPMYMRGIRVIQISVLPYFYDSNNRSIVLYENMSINIDFDDFDEAVDEFYQIPLSADFESIISGLVPNFQTRTRNENIKPCVLYICGGNSLSNSSMQDLINWRKEMGYEVHVAETNQIGSSTGSIKNYIEEAYESWNNPPEYIVLVGDTGGSYAIPYFSTTWGASDFDYTLIEGDDLLPEMIVGRISAEGSSDLNNIINKTLAYEKATYMDFTGTNWYERAALNADPSSSGNSTIITNEYIEEILEQNGFEDVQTNYGNGNYSSWMQSQLSEGLLYFNYRGYIGTSGFGSGNINNANNGYMNPFATFITCSTGDFNYTSLSEDFIRAGSETNPKGAVAAVGTATSSTHTAPNNIIQMGIYDGIFSKELKTAGASLVNAKVTLFNTYIVGAYGTVDNFTHWNNLMGDPVLNLWTDTPQALNVQHSPQINWGSNHFQVVIQDEEQQYIENAWVTLTKEDWGDESLSAFTDQNGVVVFNLNYTDESPITLTVTGKNFIPYQTNIQITNESNYIILDQFYIEESSGIEDGYINSRENVQLFLDIESSILFNEESFFASITPLTDNIVSNTSYIEFDLSETSILGPFDLTALDLIDNELIKLHVNISDSWSDWNYIIELTAESANINIVNLNWDENGEGVAPGLNPGLILTLINDGDIPVNNCTIELLSESAHVDIGLEPMFFSNFNVHEQINFSDPISINFSNDIINGTNINFQISITSDSYNQIIPFNVTVGSVTVNDPLGPDSHGYYIYDSQDWGYDLTPSYDWIEIDPSEGGDGYNLQISDGGNGNNITNSTKHVDLPFTFTFYGEDYNEISVNANGWISFGNTNMESFRNYPMPGAGGPSPMVAAFWDDLKTVGNSGVYTFSEDNYFIIEWSEMKTYDQNSDETFQIILYDAVTPTGDDEIKIQYKEFNNTSAFNYNHPVYSTVGIENHLGNIGLEYTYNNQYPTAAMPLFDQSAIFITTRNTNVYNLGDVNQDEGLDVLDIILIVNHILNIQNLSSLGEYLADINQNSTINILDVIMLINIILDS